MSFDSPDRLAFLAVPVAFAVLYVLLLRRRRSDVARFTNLELLESIIPPERRRWIRHLPAVGLIVALALFVIAVARPIMSTDVPRSRTAVVLVMDVSLSMQANDVVPDRFSASKEAAKFFAGRLPPEVNLGLVSFAGTAGVVAPPSRDRESVSGGIDALRLAESTATGDAIYAALQSVRGFNQRLGNQQPEPGSSRIVLLSDGKQTVPDTNGEDGPRGSFTAARDAQKEGVPIDTISFGTSYGSINLDGGIQSVAVDDRSMKIIADTSGGSFKSAATLAELTSVYDGLVSSVGYEEVERVNSEPWYVAGAILTSVALAISIGTGRRIP